jgi:hypothetical protein
MEHDEAPPTPSRQLPSTDISSSPIAIIFTQNDITGSPSGHTIIPHALALFVTAVFEPLSDNLIIIMQGHYSRR